MSEYEPEFTLVNNKTGEYRHLQAGDKFIPKSQSEGYKQHIKNREERKELINTFGYFVFKSNNENAMDKIHKMTNSDLARLIYTITYLDYDGTLRKDDGSVINKTELFKLVNVKRPIFNSWFNDMVDKEIFLTDGNELIRINNDDYVRGEIKKSEYTRVFINAVRMTYEANIGKNMSTLGIVFKLIPFIHIKENMLCFNPKCANEDKINYMTVGDICNEIDEYKENPKKLKQMLAKHKMDNGEPLFLFVSDGIESMDDTIMINPRLCYRGDMKNIHESYKLFQFYHNRQKNRNSNKRLKNGNKILLK